MSSITGYSPKGPARYLGPNVFLPTIVSRQRPPTGADYIQPETGKKYPLGSFWLIGPNPTSGIEGDYYYLAKIVANVATWQLIDQFTTGPAFLFYLATATANNITGQTGTPPYVLGTDALTQGFQLGGANMAADGTFTVPTDGDGCYCFSVQVLLANVGAVHTFGTLTASANGVTSVLMDINPGAIRTAATASDLNHAPMGGSINLNLAATDTVTFSLAVGGDAGTQTVGLFASGSSPIWTYIQGFKVDNG